MGSSKQKSSAARRSRKGKKAGMEFGHSKLTKSLTYAYISALSIIAILTMIGHMVTEQISHKLIQGAEITYAIGRQRALVQQTSTYAQEFFNTRDRIEYDFLSATINDMEKGHELLVARAESKDQFGNRFSNVLYDAYFAGKQYGAQGNKDYIISAKQFVNLPESKDREMERKTLLAEVTGQRARTLVTTFDIILEDYQAELLEKINKAYAIQSWSAGSIIMILLLEAAFIFRPLVKRIKEYHHLLLKEALEDHLTGLYNRRAFLKRSLMELAKARREKSPTTIVLTDLDHFKSVNDTYGHKVGDHVLKHFSDLVRESFRSGDITGRIGGEEFAFVLPSTEKEKGTQIIERFRNHICSNPCYYPDEETGEEKSLGFTASFGAVVSYDHTKSIESLLAAADENLYSAKKSGRNRLIISEIRPARTARSRKKESGEPSAEDAALVVAVATPTEIPPVGEEESTE